MSTSNSTFDAYDTPRKPNITVFTILTVTAMVVCGASLYLGQAPLTSPFVEDWIGWAHIQPTSAAVIGGTGVIFLLGLLGMLSGLMSAANSRQPGRGRAYDKVPFADDESVLAVPAALAMETSGDNRGSLKFETPAQDPTMALDNQPHAALPIESLEPKIFSDNASDSFLSVTAPVAASVVSMPEPQVPAVAVFDSNAVLSDSHGLHIGSSTAQAIPLHPETAPVLHVVEDMSHAAEPHDAALDPLGAALLADTHATPSAAPPSDINSVINSAKRFMQAPEPLIQKDAAPVAALAVAAPVAVLAAASSVPHPVDHEAEVRQAVQTALSVWPDSTRALVADELTARITYLYHDSAPDSSKAFHQIASGDLTAAGNTLQNQAGIMAQVGLSGEAAEVWRIMGALHMGRDDPKAMMAYEKVSELDPMDANIHLYLARRYQMSGETAKQLPVLGRALAVISDPATRMELLAPYADLKMKAGDAKTAGDAFSELSQLQGASARPDDVAARSAYGISLARAAQAREAQGAKDQAGPLYKQAYGVFADLSAQKPDHPGLKAMADSAQRDAQRLHA